MKTKSCTSDFINRGTSYLLPKRAVRDDLGSSRECVLVTHPFVTLEVFVVHHTFHNKRGSLRVFGRQGRQLRTTAPADHQWGTSAFLPPSCQPFSGLPLALLSNPFRVCLYSLGLLIVIHFPDPLDSRDCGF
jgi:hypothetical protein